MTQRVRVLLPVSALLVIALAAILVFWWQHRTGGGTPQATTAGTETTAPDSGTSRARVAGTTRIHAHNLLLRKGANFRIYVRWLSGTLNRTRRSVNPSFDNPDSFALNVQSGVIRANIGDIGEFLNTSLVNSPLTNVKLLADGSNLKMTGTVHKVMPLPVQVVASVSATADNRVRLHVLKIDVLRLPVKGLLHLFHISPADLIKPKVNGIEVQGNDILLDTYVLLPPPHILGHLTHVSIESPDIQAVYGDAERDVERVELWRNFFSLKGGTIDFGNITMEPVDLLMIDISKDPWFDIDLVNYRAQFASGYTRMTSDSGLQMFMPDRRDIPQKPPPNDDVQWFKNRNIPPPPQIVASVH
jgi:hypothetical protein